MKYKFNVREFKYQKELFNYTQTHLAILLNVSRQTICNLERGKYQPSLDLYLRICELLICPYYELIQEVSS
jgi:DNA-binding XRE family transcriptional regulator